MSQSESKPFGDLSNNEEESPFYIKMAEHNLNYDEDPNKPVQIKDIALCFTSCKWGQGEQGYQLLENLFLSLSSSREKPRFIIFLDAAVFLCTNECMVESVECLKQLEEAGVQLLLHEKSVQEHQLMTSIQVGNIVKFQQISRVLMDVGNFVNF
tara:strand:+ start:1519 stop:1980 length:462 start_codon:yes stop_codon:yes gene_type:complete